MAQTQQDEGQRAGAITVPLPLFGGSDAECSQCYGCLRHCPADALKFQDDRISVIEERCVKCGACVQECGKASQSVRDDTDAVRRLLASDAPVVLIMASEYVAAIHPLSRAELDSSLTSLGFAGVETTILGEEIVAAAYDQMLSAVSFGPPRLRSTCPVTVDWVRRFYPQLTGALIPVVPPYIAQARLVRALYPSNIAIVYASPCYARKDEVFQEALAGDIDVAIGFDELRTLVAEVPHATPQNHPPRKPQVSKCLSAIDGFPRHMISAANCTNGTVATVRGLDDLDRMLSAIVRGETAPGVVDMLCCEGCIDGPCVNRDLSVFAKRAIDIAERGREAPPVVDTRTLLSALPTIELGRAFKPEPAPVREPTAEEIDEVLAAGEFMSRDEVIDCGACGRATCIEQAVAIWGGTSTWDLCFPLQKKLLTRECEHHAEASVTDDLTGLMNRRAFDQRLAEEVERAVRYGTPLSLVMIDLDGFKGVNDRLGHAAGDTVLRSFGELLRSELRATDIAVRYGGDEFALVLPGINKTGAWAVAEKVCGRLRTQDFGDEGGLSIRSTASMGVASLSDHVQEATALLEHADAALYRAKRAGRDRVELAAG